MTDKPPAYENQFPAGYGMQSEQPGGWTAAAPPPRQQQGNFPPQYQQQQQQQQQQPTVTQYVSHHLNFGKQPVTTTCTNCNSSITTVLRENTGIFQVRIRVLEC